MSKMVNPKLGKNVVDIVGDTTYYRLTLGRDKFTVTERMGEHIIGAVEELNIRRKTGFISQAEYQAEIREIKSGLYRDIGRTNVLFENIVERTGIINVLLEGKVEVSGARARSFKGISDRLTPQQYEELQRLARNINIISRSRIDATNFYHEVDDAFKDVTNFYKSYFARGGTLTQDEIDGLINSAKIINKMAEKYVR